MSEQEGATGKRRRHRRGRTGDRALGLRVRKARLKSGLSQEQAANQIERSGRWLLWIENGRTDPAVGDLARLAELFGVELEQLVLDGQRANGSAARHSAITASLQPEMMLDGGQLPTDPRLDELRRRGFLQAGLVVTGGVMLGLWPPFEEAAESAEMAELRRGLLHYGREATTERPNLAGLRQVVRDAWANRQQSRYSAVLQAAPSILSQARAAAQELDGDDRCASLQLLAETYRLIFDLLRKVGDSDLATIAADRGMIAAQENGHPAVIASATGCLRAVLSAGRHHSRAIELATSAATCLEPVALRGGDPEHLSTYGNTLLAGGEAAAQAGDRGLSDDFYREADRVARLLGQDANHSFTAFGPTNVVVHRVHAAILLGDGERAVRLAKDLDLTQLPVVERRAHHTMDVAIAYGLIEKPERALHALLMAEQIAPEEVRLDPGAHALVDELGRRRHRHCSELAALAQRMNGKCPTTPT
jgi:transcriptional regulator with XRE-family HTH domain